MGGKSLHTCTCVPQCRRADRCAHVPPELPGLACTKVRSRLEQAMRTQGSLWVLEAKQHRVKLAACFAGCQGAGLAAGHVGCGVGSGQVLRALRPLCLGKHPPDTGPRVPPPPAPWGRREGSQRGEVKRSHCCN